METVQNNTENPNTPEAIWAILRENAERQKENDRQRRLQRQEDERKWRLQEEQWEKQRQEDERKWRLQEEQWEKQRQKDELKRRLQEEQWEKQRQKDELKRRLQEEQWEKQRQEDELNRRKQRQEDEIKWREWEKRAALLDKQIGKLGNRFGDMVEYLVVPDLVEKFNALGFAFKKSTQHTSIEDREHNIFTEFDITLENSEKIMIIEVKSKLTTEGITEHLERMEKVRIYADLHGDNRVYLGAVAGIVMTQNEKDFALKNGFYVLEPSGDVFSITEPKGIYSPKEW